MNGQSNAGTGSIVFFLRVPDPLDPLRRVVEDVDHLVEELVVPAFVGDAVAQRRHQIADRPADLGPLAAPAAMAIAFEPLDYLGSSPSFSAR